MTAEEKYAAMEFIAADWKRALHTAEYALRKRATFILDASADVDVNWSDKFRRKVKKRHAAFISAARAVQKQLEQLEPFSNPVDLKEIDNHD